MADLEVDIGSMKSLHSSVKDSVDDLEKQLQSMYQSVEELSATWEGPNHDVFTENFVKNVENMKELNKSLQAYAKALNKVRTLYGKCEEEVWQIVRAQ